MDVAISEARRDTRDEEPTSKCPFLMSRLEEAEETEPHHVRVSCRSFLKRHHRCLRAETRGLSFLRGMTFISIPRNEKERAFKSDLI